MYGTLELLSTMCRTLCKIDSGDVSDFWLSATMFDMTLVQSSGIIHTETEIMILAYSLLKLCFFHTFGSSEILSCHCLFHGINLGRL